MQTLDAPIYEINQDSEWFKSEKKRREDMNGVFKELADKYELGEGFSYYHSEYFGIYSGTEAYKKYKDELVKNPDKNGWHAFRKLSKYFSEIKTILNKVEERNPFMAHDVLGLNNISASQWVDGRWYFGVKNIELIKDHNIVTPIDFKDYLKIVMNALEENPIKS